jgi:hypothetical protein
LPGVPIYLNELAALIVPNAISLRVRVDFDAGSDATQLCTLRPLEGVLRARLARRKLYEVLAEIREIGPGPSCLAARQFTFNRVGAKDWEIDAIERRCADRSRRLEEAVARGGDPLAVARRGYDRCIESKRDWVYVGIRGKRVAETQVREGDYLFEATRPRAERIQTSSRLRSGCHGWKGPQELLGCMADHGWRLIDGQADFAESWPDHDHATWSAGGYVR